MELALEEARRAYDSGEFPVGCVVVNDNRVLASAGRTGTAFKNGVFNEVDHAEIRAIKRLAEVREPFDPKRTALVCTMEPCLMCLSACIFTGIKTLVYAYEDPMGGGTGIDFSRAAPLYKNSRLEIIPGVLRQKSLDLFYKFFNKEDNLYWKGSYLAAYTLEQGQKSK